MQKPQGSDSELGPLVVRRYKLNRYGNLSQRHLRTIDKSWKKASLFLQEPILISITLIKFEIYMSRCGFPMPMCRCVFPMPQRSKKTHTHIQLI